MALYTAQVIGEPTGHLPRDRTVNVYHFTGSGGDPAQLASDLANAYKARLIDANAWLGGIVRLSCKVYDAGGAAPNPPLATFQTDEFPQNGSGPREVAVCLSQRGSPALSGRPPGLLPTERGRTFMGPLSAALTDTPRPGPDVRDVLLDLAEDIRDAGGAGFVWACGSDRVQVSQVYIDDEWDTQRRRGFRPTSRSLRTI